MRQNNIQKSIKIIQLYYHSTMSGLITEDQLRTAPDDPRFPNQNQTK